MALPDAEDEDDLRLCEVLQVIATAVQETSSLLHDTAVAELSLPCHNSKQRINHDAPTTPLSFRTFLAAGITIVSVPVLGILAS